MSLEASHDRVILLDPAAKSQHIGPALPLLLRSPFMRLLGLDFLSEAGCEYDKEPQRNRSPISSHGASFPFRAW